MSTLTPANDRSKANGRTFVWLAGFALFMLGMSFAAVPLYDLFCRVTGYGGTTQVSAENPRGVIDRQMEVRFLANIEAGLPLRVEPARIETNDIGTVRTVVYRATNLTNQPLSTTASYNVTPESTGLYFNKIECFCFTQQTLEPYETVEMPVTYFVDPDLDQNSELRTIRQVTLSYTFHRS